MIDAGYTSKPITDTSPYTNAASATKADQGDGRGGFYETLSNVGQQNRKPDNHNDAGKAPESPPAQTTSDDRAAASNDAPGAEPAPKPVIDLHGSSAHSAANSLRNERGFWSSARDKAEDGDTKARAVKDRHALIKGEQTADSAEADIAASLADGKHLAQAKPIDASKTDKTKAATAGEGEGEGKGEPAAAASAESALSDVLNLLSGEGKSVNAAVGAGPGGISARKGTDGVDVKGDLANAKGHAVEAKDALDNDADGGATGMVDADRDFRFVRADGKSMAMRTGSGAAAAEDGEAGAKEPAQTVNVIEARRFLAPAAGNSANLVATMIGDGEWARAMRPESALLNAASQTSSGNVVNTLKIQMHPIELGSVVATLRLSGDTLTVELTVENSAAYRKITDDQRDIVNALRQQGYAVDQVQVSMASSGRAAADGGQQDGQSQQAQQQAQQGSGQGGNSAGRQQEQAGTFGGMAPGGVSSDEAMAGKSSGGNADGARAGGVYI